jgi:ABC-type uncharacterized transport system substrate-binding protein
MRRREFIAGLGSAAAWPPVARTQQAAMPVVGVLHQATFSELRRPLIEAFHRGLAEIGYVEGRTVAIEYRWAEDHYDRLPALAADFVRRQVAVIVALGGTPAALAAKAATRTIPIVFLLGADPVEYDLVASLARPGGNITGFTILSKEVVGKRLGLMHELVPATTSITFLYNPTNVSSEIDDVQNAARALGMRVLMVGATRQSDIEPAFVEMAQQRAGALVVSSDSLFFGLGGEIATLAVRHAIPAILAYRETGALISYGPSIPAVYRQAGAYAGRILNGEKPADLPVQQPVKFDMAINLRVAKALGLTIPETLLATADQVIE